MNPAKKTGVMPNSVTSYKKGGSTKKRKKLEKKENIKYINIEGVRV